MWKLFLPGSLVRFVELIKSDFDQLIYDKPSHWLKQFDTTCYPAEKLSFPMGVRVDPVASGTSMATIAQHLA
jgi:hypothetical protein